MPSQKPKPAAKLTTEEAIRRLFPAPVIDRVKRGANEAPATRKKSDPKSMTED